MGQATTPASAWILDHVGHAVHDIDAGIAFYSELLGVAVAVRESLPEHRVEVAFFDLGNSSIELIAPQSGNTALTKFLDSRGEGLHHICYRVKSVDAELAILANRGVRLIDAKARNGSRNTLVAFVHPQGMRGVLVELCCNR